MIALPHFSPLTPFDATTAWPFEAQARGQILKKRRLHLDFVLRGDLTGMNIPEPSTKGERKDGLWNHTCFEAFLSARGVRSYLEFNLSPTGDWNMYSFSDYRQGQKPVDGVSVKFVRQQKGRSELALTAEIGGLNLPWAGEHPQELILGLSTIIEFKDGNKAYCAISHFSEKPDFHRRESFNIKLGKV